MVVVWSLTKTATESKSRATPLRKRQLHRFWGPVCRKLAPDEKHEKVKKEKTTGSKVFDPKEAPGLARCAWRGQTGACSPSASDCFNYKLGTWNVRSLRKEGKMANVMLEMRRMEVNIMGVAETCWQENGSITSQIPKERKDGMDTDTDADAGGDTYKIFYSGGDKNRRGVVLIVAEEVLRSVLMMEPISERIIITRLKMKPTNVLIVQIYASCEDEEEEEKDQFY